MNSTISQQQVVPIVMMVYGIDDAIPSCHLVANTIRWKYAVYVLYTMGENKTVPCAGRARSMEY